MRAIVPTDHHVRRINETLKKLPPSINYPNGTTWINPIITDGIVSAVVKCAGASESNRAHELEAYISEVLFNLSPCDKLVVMELVSDIKDLYNRLISVFTSHGWYDDETICPWRFTGFFNVYSFDIYVIKPG